jgi:hypothetical protein
MPIYTVHEPPLRKTETAADPSRFRFVRDGFHFWAFVFGPLWMLRYRLWLVLLCYVLLSVLLRVAMWFTGGSSNVAFFVGVMVSLLIGLEASTLRRWTLGRRGWRTVGVVAAEDVESAERRFFDAWAEQPTRPQQRDVPPPAAPGYAPSAQQPPILGLFPEPGVPR